MRCLPAMRSEPKIGHCSHPSSPRAGSTTSTPSPTSPKPSRLSSTVTHKARSKTSCPGDSERRQAQVLKGIIKALTDNRYRYDDDQYVNLKPIRYALSGHLLGPPPRAFLLRRKRAKAV